MSIISPSASALQEQSEICPYHLRLRYHQVDTNSSDVPETQNDECKKRSNFIPDEYTDATILALLMLILLIALLAIITLACMYFRSAKKLSDVLIENRIIHYAAQSMASLTAGITETANEIRVLEISEPITDRLDKLDENCEGPITNAKFSTSSEEHIYHSVRGRKSTCV